MLIAAGVAALCIVLIVCEYRLRKPDQLILYESNGAIGFRTARFYPRHFSLAIPGTTHFTEQKIDGVAKGSIQIQTKLVVTVAPSREHIAALVRVGGWNDGAVVKAAKELDTVIQGLVKEFTEKYPLEELSSEQLSQHLAGKLSVSREKFGLDVVSLTVQSVDPVDPAIADAMRQRESARILEQTETLNQQARVASALAKLKADERIALSEHELDLKKYDLKNEELEKETLLAQKRIEDELQRSRMRLAYEKEEMALLKSNPELLLLTPQAARLAEASQNLKNARTIVSLAPGDVEHGSRLMGLFQQFLEGVLKRQIGQSRPESERQP